MGAGDARPRFRRGAGSDLALSNFRRALAAPWWPATLVCAVYAAVVWLGLAAGGGDPMLFVHPEERSDGIHYYRMALDPLGSWAGVGSLYYQRILYPLISALLALGQAGLVPWALVAVNLLAATGVTYLLGEVLHSAGRSRWWALALAFHPGMFVPIYYDLTEPLSLLLSLLGLWLARQEQQAASWAALLLAMLARETALFFVIPLLAFYGLRGEWRRVILGAFVTLGGYAAWQALVWWLTGQLPALASGLQYSLLPFQRGLSDDLGAGGAAPWPFLIQIAVPAVGLAGLALSRRSTLRQFAPLLVLAQALFVAYLPWPTTTGFIHYDRNALGLILAGLLLGASATPNHGLSITGALAAWKRPVAYALVLLSGVGGWLLLVAGLQRP